MFKTTIQLGGNQIEITAETMEEFFLACGPLSRAPKSCGNCGSVDLRLHGDRKKDEPDGWVYCSIRCYNCRYQLKVGRRRDGQFYVREDEGWFPPYTGPDHHRLSDLQADYRPGDAPYHATTE